MSNSIGNLKNSGLKGNNWPWQYKVLLGLDKIASSIVTGGKEYEAELVNISCSGPVPPAGDIVRLEIRIFDTVTGGFTSVQYYEPGSTTPDPADYSGCTITYITGESGGATEVTLQQVETNTASDATTLTSSSTTGAGTIPAGSKAATIYIDGAGGSINTVPRPDGWSQSFEFNNDTLPDIPYDGGGTATVYVDILT
jgi:hypothetical protein